LGKVGIEYTYSSATIDSNSHTIFYLFDWGDGNDSGWLGPYISGEICESSHAWSERGRYPIKVRAKDSIGFVSDWSPIFLVSISDDGENDDTPIVQLIHPVGGELLSGTATVEWYAICPDGIKSTYLFYSPDDGDTWRQIGEDLYNNVDVEHGNYQWNTGSLSDGQYMLKVEVFGYEFNIGMDTSDPFTIDNGYAGVRVSDVRITDTTIDSYKWIKNGDNNEITAGITGSISINREDISAELSGFGMGTVIAETFDGFTATWTLNNVECTPSEGTITVTVTVEELDSNSATITADNTNPELNIYKPLGGLYFFNTKLLPLSRTIIIGAITIDIDTDDNNGIERAEFYIDNELMETVTDDVFEWYTKLPKGQHRREVLIYDYAGNKAIQTVDFLKFL